MSTGLQIQPNMCFKKGSIFMALIATPSIFEPYSLQDIVGFQSCVMWVQVKTNSTLCLNRCLNPVQNHAISLSLNIHVVPDRLCVQQTSQRASQLYQPTAETLQGLPRIYRFLV